MASIQKILIANRGEIACRVMQTAHGLGLQTVAVYSDADAQALHVRLADEAVHIGAGPVGESYLLGDKIIAAAQASGADAIHPGYGFLSENAEFAEAVSKAGLIFIGPSAEAIALMGNKSAAKKRMIEADIPCVPGYQGDDQSDKKLQAEADKIGYPVMVKAAAGGGGRGMRLVMAAKEMKDALQLARSESENAFGSAELILEKAVQKPRHVEIQVFADQHGNVVHLGERDCSVQRRHQKVIEEAPCPVMTPQLRDAMGQSAVEVARAIDYVGAGTVEFLLDEKGAFYFLEMNTRLQVEHPVTELVTGLDLVEMQIHVAAGGALPVSQEDVRLDGHALEVRLYAEDPSNEFLPSTGFVSQFTPYDHLQIRVDQGIVSGQDISPFYDPMVAKIISYGDTRDAARQLMVTALRETVLYGPATNRGFLMACLEQENFIDGDFSTAFIDEHFAGSFQRPEIDFEQMAALALALYQLEFFAMQANAVHMAGPLAGFLGGEELAAPYLLACGETTMPISIKPCEGGFDVQSGADIIRLLLAEAMAYDGENPLAARRFVMRTKRRSLVCHARLEAGQLWANLDGQDFVVQNILRQDRAASEAAHTGRIDAPLHGRVIDVFVSAGDKVASGDRLAVLEAMKMQHEILAEADGVVQEVFIVADQQVGAGDMMIDLDIENTA